MERKPERLECVISISKMLLWVVQSDPVELMFPLWDIELMGVWMQLRVMLARSTALPGSLCCVGNMETAAPSLGIAKDNSSPVPLGKGWPGPNSALVIPEPALAKLQRALAYLGRCR